MNQRNSGETFQKVFERNEIRFQKEKKSIKMFVMQNVYNYKRLEQKTGKHSNNS